MVDSSSGVAVHTGPDCIPCAGDAGGAHWSCQANMMERDTVPAAMSAAFEHAEGELADRLMAALDAAEGEGGDVRGRQSAALLVVPPDRRGVETRASSCASRTTRIRWQSCGACSASSAPTSSQAAATS